MSNYTTQLRNIVENCSINDLTLNTRQRIEIARSFIFDFEYPIWNEEYKKELETKIIRHYYTKEIGLETVGLWKFYLEERLNLIMPYYNTLYATTVKDYDYLTNFNTTETFENIKTSNNTSNVTQADTTEDSQTITDNGTSKVLRSDTPQANYNNLDYATMLDDSTIDNTSTKNDTVTTNKQANATDNNTMNDNYTKQHKGNNGNKSFTELVVEYRSSILNIDNQIIDELKDLFMMIY